MKKTCQALLVVLLTACGPATSVTGDWRGTPAKVAFGHVLVVGVSANSRVRRSFELALADQIRSGRTRATAAVQEGDGAMVPTADNTLALARDAGADALVVTRLASRKVAATETESRVGVKTRQPGSLDGGPGLVELFSLEYQEYEDPGELTARSTVVLQTEVYDVRQADRLVYVMTTKARFREDRDDVIGSVSSAIAGQLRRAGLVR